MNVQELLQIFEANQVPETYYVVGGLGIGECYGIEKVGERWHVYYSERGSKTTQSFFDDEDSACRFLLELIAERVRDELGRDIRV